MSLGGICRIEHAVGVGVNGAGGRQKARRSIRMRALPELEASQAVLVAATALALVGGVFGGRFVAYSQTQVARAGMLSNCIPRGNKRVLMIGGDTKDLYYLPRDIDTATLVDPEAKESLWQQAAIQAGAPVAVRNRPYEDLRFAPDRSFDAAVILAPFSAMSDPLKCCQEALRTLKPGSPLIVLQRQIGGSALQGVLGGCEGATTSQLDRLSELEGIAKISWDVAGKGLDPHAVGVITRGAMTADKAAEKKDSIESRVRSGGKQEQRDGKGF